MQANVIGRVRNTNLAKNQGLLPLYEAIINSIDAIEETNGSTPNGNIDITVLRHYALPMDGDELDQRYSAPIRGFVVQDNGIGFTDENYLSFNEADTQIKASKGGKGVGRFIWLKAFQKVEVESVFAVGNKYHRRKFEFSLSSTEGIHNHNLQPLSTPEPIQTTVRLLDFKSEYEERIPHNPQAIAHRIVEHCLEYLLLGRFPRITFHEETEDYVIELEDVYSNLVANVSRNQFAVNGQDFDINHFKIHAHTDLTHHVSFCANNRVVKTVKITNRVPNLSSNLGTDKNETFVYAGYVSSAYLDGHVNQQRTDFDTLPEGGFEIPGELTWSEIENVSVEACKIFLKPYTETVKVEKEERIRRYVSEHAPEFRYLVNHYTEELDAILPDISDEKLNTQLYEIQRKIETDLREEADNLFETLEANEGQDYGAWEEQFSKFWQDFNELGKARLAQYIVHRKMMLTFLEKALKLQETGKYSREDVIHRIIFPLKTISDDVTPDQHNLWIIDEKLSYHQYLASDKPLKKIQPIDSDFDSRPDLLVFFNSAFATADDEPPYNSGIVIFEFKRPMRDDYSEYENPISQVLGYVKQIKEGNALQKDGRLFQIPQTTPFYCYIVCDPTSSIKDQADYHNLRPTPDANGYFGYFENLGAYVELISFDKLLRDAQKRNRILFDKLNLPAKVS